MSEEWRYLEPLMHKTFGRLLAAEEKIANMTAVQPVSTSSPPTFGADALLAGMQSLQQQLTAQAEEMAALKQETISLRAKVMALEDENKRLRSAGGRQPKKAERYYQNLLAAKLGFGHCPISRVGVTDITTPDTHIEIKNWRDYDDVPGQLQKYQKALKRPNQCVYFFGEEPGNERFGQIIELMKDANIEVFSFDSNDHIRKHDIVEPEPDHFDKFAEAHIVEEDGARLGFLDLRSAFMVWAEKEKRTIPQKSKLLHLFTSKLGARYHNQLDGTWLNGWRNKRLKAEDPGPQSGHDDAKPDVLSVETL